MFQPGKATTLERMLKVSYKLQRTAKEAQNKKEDGQMVKAHQLCIVYDTSKYLFVCFNLAKQRVQKEH